MKILRVNIYTNSILVECDCGEIHEFSYDHIINHPIEYNEMIIDEKKCGCGKVMTLCLVYGSDIIIKEGIDY